MQRDQQPQLAPDEMRATMPNERAETVAAVQVAAPDEHMWRGKESERGTSETTLAPPRVHRQFALPAWPTSQPGPRVPAPSPGQRLVPRRTDQVMYDCSDQERGLPGFLPPRSADQEREKQP
jgi:hypothetical protein